MSNLLALDQASKTTGYTVFKDGQIVKVDKFTYDTANLDTRLVQIRTKVKELIDEYEIEEVIYEDIQEQNNNVATFKVLAEVYGIISELLEELHIPHSSVLAVQWKSAIGIKGKTRAEQKRNTQAYVLENYGLKVTQDEADSIGIGLYKIKQSINDWTD